MKILNCFAHLDDAEIWAGGTILKHSSRGDSVETIAFVQSDEPRIEESQNAHRILGARLTLYENDLSTDSTKIVEILSSHIQDAKPDIVLTHWHSDCHPDHRNVFYLVSKAIIIPWINNSMPKAFFAVDTYGSQGLDEVFSPSHYIDVTSQWGLKMQAIEQFKSQPFEMWRDMVTIQNRLFGGRVGVKYAEGFLQIPIQGKLNAVDYLI